MIQNFTANLHLMSISNFINDSSIKLDDKVLLLESLCLFLDSEKKFKESGEIEDFGEREKHYAEFHQRFYRIIQSPPINQ